MAEVTNELIHEVLKAIQDRFGSVEHKVGEVKAELQALRAHSIAVQQDVHNIYAAMSRHDARLERIERRLELTEA